MGVKFARVFMNEIRQISDVEKLSEIEDVVRNMPPREHLHHRDIETLSWLGRAVAAIGHWDSIRGLAASGSVSKLRSPLASSVDEAGIELIILLSQARSDLRMKTLGPLNVVVGQGLVFDYFDEIRKQIALAKSALFIVDP
jgi:hypothetical protein